MGYLLDTNIISELRRPRPHPGVIEFLAAHPLHELHISTVSLSEIRFGIELVTDAKRRLDLHEWLTHSIRPMFEHRVLPVSEDVMLTWRILLEDGRKRGHTHAQPDLIIAATAQCHGLSVVTRDERHFAQAGMDIINPWEATN